MINKLYAALSALNLKKESKRITVALSGGKDSMALLYGLLSLKDKLGIEVSAAHFNHLLRGEESFRDENFVIEQCNNLGVPLTVERGDVNGYAVENKMSIEQAARELRYDFLKRVNSGVVATAHTASDNLETVLLHILRGSGLDGLCGIPQQRDIYIRPMLGISTQEVISYCQEEKIKYVTDSTNLSDEYSRNFLRLNVIPLLKELNPSLDTATERLIGTLKTDKDLIDSLVLTEYTARKKDGGLYIGELDKLHNAISSRVILSFLEENGFSVSAERVDLIKRIILSGGKLTLDNGRIVEVKNNILAELKNNNKAEFKTEIIEEDVAFIKTNGKINNLLLKNAIDCDKIEGILRVRTKQSGDEISFSHRNVTKPLRKLLSEDGVDIAIRDTLPVIADDKGVVWVYSYGVDKRVCPDTNTKRIYFVKSEQIN